MRLSKIVDKHFDGSRISSHSSQTRSKKKMKIEINWFYIFSVVFVVLLVNWSTVSVSGQSIGIRAVNNNVNQNTDTDTSPKVKVTPNPAEKGTSVSKTTVEGSANHMNCSNPDNFNNTICKEDNDGMVNYFLKKMSNNSGMLFRTMYVLLTVTGIVVVYFLIKAVRLRRRRSKSRKYGIITKQGDRGDMEMEPLGDGNDEDDDYTVFEMGRRK